MDINLEVLWEQLHHRLCLFICSRIANGDDAEDILQEVFVRLHTHLDTIRELDKVESWLYQVARNSITDYYRSGRRLAPLTELILAEPRPEESAAESLAPYIRQVVETLPEPYREALVLTEYQGLSQKELAERLGLSFSGAKSRVQRAREKVKDILLTCCHFELDARGTVYDFHKNCCCCERKQILVS
jgi:RNA polymerase sigma-70 factor, ECF subfamily